MSSQPIRFLISGYGYIGKRHAHMIQNHPGADWLGVIEIDPAKRAEAEQAGVRAFANWEEARAHYGPDLAQNFDVAVIATPNGLHAEHALEAIESGLHVVIEKPMATKVADAENIMHRALQRSRQVFAVMQNRYSPPSQWLKDIMRQGLLGDIYMVQVNCYWNRDERYYTGQNWHGSKQLDGGTLFTQFSHFIDMMYWLFGDITNIRTRLRDFNHGHLTEFEDSGVVHFDWVRGGMGSLNFSTSVFEQNMESSLTVVAQHGAVKVGGQYMDQVEYCRIQNYTMPELPPTNPGNDYGAYKGSAQNHNYVIDNVVRVLNGETTITTNALEGLKVVDIIERIYAASE